MSAFARLDIRPCGFFIISAASLVGATDEEVASVASLDAARHKEIADLLLISAGRLNDMPIGGHA